MELGAAGLAEQPFPTHGKPLTVVSYASTVDAIETLNEVKVHPSGLALLQGPPLSGKTTVIQAFVNALPDKCYSAVIDGQGLNTSRLLHTILAQFGFELEPSSTNELFGLLRVFVLQQTATNEAPVVVIENAHDLRPSALRTLCEIAGLRVRQNSAVKIVLASDRSLNPIVTAPAMETLAKRALKNFHLRPMTSDEVQVYLHRKLEAAGCESPGSVFPADVCNDIWLASAGWPGIVDRIALLALAQTDSLPVNNDAVEHPALPIGTWADLSESAPVAKKPPVPPQIVVSEGGKVIKEHSMERSRALIGRSEHNDISIDSRFVSRHHVLLLRHGSSTFLMDLNSTNGTFVNSKRVSNHIMVHDDVITIGHHHFKFLDPSATGAEDLVDIDFADTAVMKTLDDMRALLVEENTTVMPAVPERLPTIKN